MNWTFVEVFPHFKGNDHWAVQVKLFLDVLYQDGNHHASHSAVMFLVCELCVNTLVVALVNLILVRHASVVGDSLSLKKVDGWNQVASITAVVFVVAVHRVLRTERHLYLTVRVDAESVAQVTR